MGARSEQRSGVTAGVLLAVSVGVLALPSAVLAFTADFSLSESADPGEDASAVTPAMLAQAISIRSVAKGKLFPFTPAGTSTRADRSVTVAVRVDPEAARAITVRGRQRVSPGESALGSLRIAPTAFSLGVSRGYRNFAQDIPPTRSMSELAEIRQYSLAPSTAGKPRPSRFSPRISLEEKSATGRGPRTFSGDSDEVDLGGAYRVTENLNVTAGVRYSEERERLRPLTDGKLDSQAVYVGTEFRF